MHKDRIHLVCERSYANKPDLKNRKAQVEKEYQMECFTCQYKQALMFQSVESALFKSISGLPPVDYVKNLPMGQSQNSQNCLTTDVIWAI